MNKLWLTFIAVTGVVFPVSACSSSNNDEMTISGEVEEVGELAQTSVVEIYKLQQQVPMTISVSSSSLKETGFLKRDFTCEGNDTSPNLSWTDVPPGTSNIVIVAEDIDAAEGPFAHWLMWGLHTDTRELVSGISKSDNLPAGVTEGTNGFNTLGWRGPCPPPRVIGSGIGGSMNNIGSKGNTGVNSNLYVLNVYAVDVSISLESGATRVDLLQAIDGHIIAGGELETKYLSAQKIFR